MDLLMRVAGIAIAGVILIVIVRRNTPELALVLGLLVAIVVFIAGLDAFREVKNFIDTVMAETGVSGELAGPLWRAGVIAIVTKIIAELCRDAGERAAATGVELAGAILGLFVVLPLFSSFFDMLRMFL